MGLEIGEDRVLVVAFRTFKTIDPFKPARLGHQFFKIRQHAGLPRAPRGDLAEEAPTSPEHCRHLHRHDQKEESG